MPPRSFATVEKDASSLTQEAQRRADEVVLREITKYCEDFAKLCKRNMDIIVAEVQQQLNAKDYVDEDIRTIDDEVSDLLYNPMDCGRDQDRSSQGDTLHDWVEEVWGAIYEKAMKEVSMEIVRKVAVAMDVPFAKFLSKKRRHGIFR